MKGVLNEYKISFWDKQNILDLGSGDRYTTLNILNVSECAFQLNGEFGVI